MIATNSTRETLRAEVEHALAEANDPNIYEVGGLVNQIITEYGHAVPLADVSEYVWWRAKRDHDVTSLLPLTEPSQDDNVYAKAAREALERPDSYLRWAQDDMFTTWGQTFGRTRDSDVLEESNYHSIKRDLDLLAVYLYGDDAPEWISDERAHHWAHGWVEYVTMRVLVSADAWAVTAVDNLAPLFIAATNIATELAEGPSVYDEEDHSERESDHWFELWTNVTLPDFRSSATDRDDLPDYASDDEAGYYEVQRRIRAGEYRDESSYLDWIDESVLYGEIAHYASDDDPSGWEDSEIVAGIMRVAERYAYGDTSVASEYEGSDPR